MSNTANLSFNESNQRWEAEFQGRVVLSSASKDYVVSKIVNQISRKITELNITKYVELGTTLTTPQCHEEQEVINFGINERFMFLEDFTSMVADREIPSAIITGPGGLGKTYTVLETLKKCGMQKYEVNQNASDEDPVLPACEKEFVVIKGFSTPKGLYRSLYENKNSLIVFDDCDSVLENSTACNILKAALDSYDERIVSWHTMAFIDDGLPQSFKFSGGVIFISNMSMNKIPQALVSRAQIADVSMSREEIVTRMRYIVDHGTFMPEVEMEIKDEALNFIAKNANSKFVKTINLRTLIGVIKARLAKPDHWERLALYSMVNAR